MPESPLGVGSVFSPGAQLANMGLLITISAVMYLHSDAVVDPAQWTAIARLNLVGLP